MRIKCEMGCQQYPNIELSQLRYLRPFESFYIKQLRHLDSNRGLRHAKWFEMVLYLSEGPSRPPLRLVALFWGPKYIATAGMMEGLSIIAWLFLSSLCGEDGPPIGVEGADPCRPSVSVLEAPTRRHPAALLNISPAPTRHLEFS